jgi:hypothetical protein
MYGTRNEYVIYGSPEYDPDVKRKSTHVVPTLIWAGTMLYFYCAYVNYVSPYQEPISCWSDPYASSATVALIQPYGTRPPTTFTASGVFYDTSNWINMTRSFWAIDVGGICLCISHIISAFLHFVRPCHKLAKPF